MMEHGEESVEKFENIHMQNKADTQPGQSRNRGWIWGLLLIGVIVIGAYFRTIGLDWDLEHHLHPDERFLTMVLSSIQPVHNLNEYFNTATSTLNPHNTGYGFFVYGTLPIFIIRYLAEWVGQTGYGEVYMVGRYLSGLADLGTILLVFLIALRLYKKPRMALLAALFMALAVLPIQLSHYATVDNWANFFIFLAIYFAVRIVTDQAMVVDRSIPQPRWLELVLRSWKNVWVYIFFGLAYGMAMASKINAYPLALLLPLAAIIWFSRLDPIDRDRFWPLILRNLAIGGVMALLAFRIFQPYAFQGPGFFNVGINQKWWENMREVQAQQNGDIDAPFALQWARRPVTFAWTNMVEWGFGAPLGLLAWAGFLWMAWRIFRGEWRIHAVLWLWTAGYFTWQSLGGNPTMRYQLPVYPSLVIMAAWAVFTLWEKRSEFQRFAWIGRNWTKVLAVFVGSGVLLATFAWAFAFTRIYARPVTRLDASEWIFQNVPAAINLKLSTTDQTINQPLAFRLGYLVQPGRPMILAFKTQQSGLITSVHVDHIANPNYSDQQDMLVVTISRDKEGKDVLAEGRITALFDTQPDGRGKDYTVKFAPATSVTQDQEYYLTFAIDSQTSNLRLMGIPTLSISADQQTFTQELPEAVEALKPGAKFSEVFEAAAQATVQQVFIPHIVDWEGGSGQKTLRLSIIDPNNANTPLGTAEIRSDFLAATDPRGSGYTFEFSQPVKLESGKVYGFNNANPSDYQQKNYVLELTLVDGEGTIGVYGSRTALESSWDDPLPYSLHNYSIFDFYTGIYRSDLNLEMYWDDNADKVQHIGQVLDQADFLFISSNRQWGSITRVPERYPLSTAYYRELLGCPSEKEIIWCYSVAQPGMFQGKLGYDLVEVSQSDPNLGPLKFNSQFAEEAFTVYDHPKVLIFKKSANYNAAVNHEFLSSVDISTAIHLPPGKFKSYPADLMLPSDRLAQQQDGGTWSDLFNRDWIWNQYPGIGLIIWYVVITLLGWIVYPFTRLALGGLHDKGYPFSKLVGMLLLAILVWWAGSAGIAFNKLNISLVLLLIVGVNALLFLRQKDQILAELRTRRKYFLTVEAVALAFFAFFLVIRLGNPDLWHPYKGGEKPMDFSYFNAVLKSTTFPPYDPWFAGGYLNYYYYGFVLVGVLVKWIGIVPAVAYNLILPTLFSFLAMGGFSIGWNLLAWKKGEYDGEHEGIFVRLSGLLRSSPMLAGVSASIGLLILGNWGTVRMIWRGFIRLVSPGGVTDNLNIFQFWGYGFQGMLQYIGGANLNYPPGEWYWIPSRVYPGSPITEFPFFTFLYGDPHAHLIALPVTVLALGWIVSILRGRWKWTNPQGQMDWVRFGCAFILGGVTIGALYPINTWDFPTYLLLACLVVMYTSFRYYRVSFNEGDHNRYVGVGKRVLVVLGSAALLVGLAILFYRPFGQWYAQGYNSLEVFRDEQSPFWSFTTHWGVFLFVIVSWMVLETIDWMAHTPVSSLNKIRPYLAWIYSGVLVLIGAILALTLMKIEIGWLVAILGIWALILIFRPGQPDPKRLVLFLTGTALFITLFVELFHLVGDSGRMNTVFKFYLQAWTMLSISAAAALLWLIPAIAERWTVGWRFAWRTALAVLVGGAALFPLLAGADKITDRMSSVAPHTLDGMAYMATSTYNDKDKTLDLSEDYRAIIWMQNNVQGSPVIVEANTVEYRWGSRFTIYTGLPGVVGWNWHQRQQRGNIVSSDWVWARVNAIGDFYNSEDRQQTESFLRKYNVSYIIVGQLERAYYTGLDKFENWNGDLWQRVYLDGQTAIYQVKK